MKRLLCILLALVIACCTAGGCSRSGGREEAVLTEAPASQEASAKPDDTDAPAGTAATEEATLEPTAAATDTPAPTAEPTDEPAPAAEQIINEKIASMTIEEKIGQLVMFGFIGGSAPDPEFLSLLEKYPIGNMIFYGDNIDKNDGAGGFDSVKSQIDLLEGSYSCGIPRFYSVDVEGGSVVRFDWQPSLASAYTLGQGGAEEAYGQFERVGSTLQSIGLNIDLAPVLDISEDPLSTFLGTRIISSDPDTVINIGSAIVNGLHAGGCLATAKHFPGHGATTEDSHDHTPVVNKSAEELFAYDIAPFAAAVENGIDCIMPSHILYPALDPNDIASMSYPILTGILRNRLGFSGIIISDEIRMGGVTSGYTAGEAAVKFITAGGDILLCGADYPAQEEVLLTLYSACESGLISGERIDESVYRVLYYKYVYGIWTP